jgi:hypothetical protein
VPDLLPGLVPDLELDLVPDVASALVSDLEPNLLLDLVPDLAPMPTGALAQILILPITNQNRHGHIYIYIHVLESSGCPYGAAALDSLRHTVSAGLIFLDGAVFIHTHTVFQKIILLSRHCPISHISPETQPLSVLCILYGAMWAHKYGSQGTRPLVERAGGVADRRAGRPVSVIQNKHPYMYVHMCTHNMYTHTYIHTYRHIYIYILNYII